MNEEYSTTKTPCVWCQKIAHFIQGGPNDRDQKTELIATFGQLVRNHECQTCQKLVGAFASLEYPNGGRFADDWLVHMVFPFLSVQAILLPPSEVPGQHARFNITLAYTTPDGVPQQRGSPVSDDWINIDTISSWIQECNKNHTGSCHGISDLWQVIERVSGLIFIDVERNCLVGPSFHGSEACEYIALSYVWGTSTGEPFQTVLENFDALQQENAFNIPRYSSRMPKTIRHAIDLTQALGIRYLWVDKFCIIQDDHAGKAQQIAAMASIYANAYITIVVAEGEDGDSGIPGLFPGMPRTQPYPLFQFSDTCKMLPDRPMTSLRKSKSAPYHSRGWTFQEFTISPRVLVFHDQTVSWACKRDLQSEIGMTAWNLMIEKRLFYAEDQTMWRSWPNLLAYAGNVEDYSSRNLRFNTDILNAFDAVLTVFGRSMNGGMLDSQGKVLKEFPSWSWAGWVGRIDMRTAARYFDCVSRQQMCYQFHGRGIRNIQVVEFYKLTKNSQAPTKTRIEDVLFFEKTQSKRYMDQSRLPSGFGFTQWVPLVDDPNSVIAKQDSHYSTIIYFKTRCLIGSILDNDKEDQSMVWPLILDRTGAAIGYVEARLSSPETPPPGNNTVSFICIGKRAIEEHAIHHEMRVAGTYRHKDCPKTAQNDQYCKSSSNDLHLIGFSPEPSLPISSCKHPGELVFYDVMWVEWEGGIAYRKAIGKIWADDWDAAETKEIEVYLG
ncbi:heterokaryon incompatibility protein-domain-containing protein [Pyrenochaeta sp. MPI-SDFR-AT-0127]|nr:heterokaryon incompatibility protein-domain-containing protein [Pyrenochaeta sp. MPI-SDFR-AT-0127]